MFKKLHQKHTQHIDCKYFTVFVKGVVCIHIISHPQKCKKNGAIFSENPEKNCTKKGAKSTISLPNVTPLFRSLFLPFSS